MNPDCEAQRTTDDREERMKYRDMVTTPDGRQVLAPENELDARDFYRELYHQAQQKYLSLEANLENTALKLEGVWDMYYQAINDAEEAEEEASEAHGIAEELQIFLQQIHYLVEREVGNVNLREDVLKITNEALHE